MAINTRSSIRLVLLLDGIGIVFLGIVLFAAGFMVEDKIPNESQKTLGIPHKSQFWAAIPVLITGILTILTASLPKIRWLNTLTAVALFISMPLLLAVMNVEGPDSRWIDFRYKLTNCNKDGGDLCEDIKAAISWYNVLVFLSDIILFLCLLALLAIFASVILSMKTVAGHQELSDQQQDDFSYDNLQTHDDMRQGIHSYEIPTHGAPLPSYSV